AADPVAQPQQKPPDKAKAPGLPDLSEFRTVDKAVTTRISKAGPVASGTPGYLGVHVNAGTGGKLVVAHVAAEAPAAQAGRLQGGVLLKVGGEAVGSSEGLRELLQTRAPGDSVKIAVERKGKAVEVAATLAATSNAMKPPEQGEGRGRGGWDNRKLS